MIAEQEAAAGRYIYAIVNDDGSRPGRRTRGFPWTPEPIGFDGCPVYAISVGRAAAVVSNVPNRPLRPERRNLATHYAVLKRLMSQKRGPADGIRDDRRQRGVHPADSQNPPGGAAPAVAAGRGQIRDGPARLLERAEHLRAFREHAPGTSRAPRQAVPPRLRSVAAGEDRARPTVRPDCSTPSGPPTRAAWSARCVRRTSRSRRTRSATSAR